MCKQEDNMINSDHMLGSLKWMKSPEQRELWQNKQKRLFWTQALQMLHHQHPILISTESPSPVKCWLKEKKATVSAALINHTQAKVKDMCMINLSKGYQKEWQLA